MRIEPSFLTAIAPLLFLLSFFLFSFRADAKKQIREERQTLERLQTEERKALDKYRDGLERKKDLLEQEREEFEEEKKAQEDALEEAREAQEKALEHAGRAQAKVFEIKEKRQEEALEKAREALEADRKDQEKAFEEKTIGFPWIAELYSIYTTHIYKSIEEDLRFRSRPALKAADEVRELKERTKEAEKKYFITLGLLKYYENLFPSLTDYQEAPDEVTQKVDSTALHEPKDPARAFLSHEEWDKLTSTEKFQRALTKYCKRKKSNWEIGREFERYIGYKYEADGWDVDYFGAKKGLEDLGRDLIARKGHKIHVVQCKYWAKGKTIHEKHIFQLYGTSIVYAIENSLKTPPTPVFVSSCQVSEIAQKAADRLGVCVCTDRTMPDYPRIKCNVGKDGEKIYHLPFDQQYDKIRIEPHKGEFYCLTVAEAEQAHFRRAYRWRGGNNG